MATITARVDDCTKALAEEIAKSIGLNLSSVINVFLKRFVAERGPFSVSDPKSVPMFNSADLVDNVSKAIKNRSDVPNPPSFFFLFPERIRMNESGNLMPKLLVLRCRIRFGKSWSSRE